METRRVIGTAAFLVTTGFGLRLVRSGRRDEAPRHGSIGWIRQWIESVNDTLKGQLDLERQAPAGHGRCHLAQLGHRRTRQAIADRL